MLPYSLQKHATARFALPRSAAYYQQLLKLKLALPRRIIALHPGGGAGRGVPLLYYIPNVNYDYWLNRLCPVKPQTSKYIRGLQSSEQFTGREIPDFVK